LDEGDHAPTRFLGGWIATFKRKEETLGRNSQSMLGVKERSAISSATFLVTSAADNDQINHCVGF
jgi:hypothetical protein